MKHRFFRTWAAILVPALALALLADPRHAQDGGQSTLGGEAWVRLGGPPGGLGYDVRVGPDQPDVWFVTDAFAGVRGVYRSADGGRTWEKRVSGIRDGISIRGLSVEPGNPVSPGAEPPSVPPRRYTLGVCWNPA